MGDRLGGSCARISVRRGRSLTPCSAADGLRAARARSAHSLASSRGRLEREFKCPAAQKFLAPPPPRALTWRYARFPVQVPFERRRVNERLLGKWSGRPRIPHRSRTQLKSGSTRFKFLMMVRPTSPTTDDGGGGRSARVSAVGCVGSEAFSGWGVSVRAPGCPQPGCQRTGRASLTAGAEPVRGRAPPVYSERPLPMKVPHPMRPQRESSKRSPPETIAQQRRLTQQHWVPRPALP